MKPPSAPSKIYSPPSYVNAFRLGGLLCLVLAGIAFVMAFGGDGSPWAGVALLLAALGNFLYADIAEAIARTHWRVDLLAHLLQPAINEAELAAENRIIAEDKARADQEAEILRVVEERRNRRPQIPSDSGNPL